MRTVCSAIASGALLVLATAAGAMSAVPAQAGGPHDSTPPADRPRPRTDQNSLTAHAELVEKARRGRIDVYFVGDSITRRWDALDYPDLRCPPLTWKRAGRPVRRQPDTTDNRVLGLTVGIPILP